jgi:flagellar protein FlaG
MEIGKVNLSVELPPASAGAVLTPEQRAEQRQLIQAVKSVNEGGVLGADNELTFSIDRRAQKPVIRIVDKNTREVVRQIPPEYVLRLAEGWKDQGQTAY